MKEIPLTQGKFALVDDSDYEWLSEWKWYASKDGNTFYAISKKGNKRIIMHRVIMNTPAGMETDHIDGNGLNNQRNNLRICTTSQNQANTGKHRDNASGFKGVSWHNRREEWRAQIKIHNKVHYIGSYDNPIDAARAYDEAAKKYHGDYAVLNFKE